MRWLIFSFVIAVTLLVQFEGCTVIGGVVGAVIDYNQPPDTVWISPPARNGTAGTLGRGQATHLGSGATVINVSGNHGSVSLSPSDSVTRDSSEVVHQQPGANEIDKNFVNTLGSPSKDAVLRSTFLHTGDIPQGDRDTSTHTRGDTSFTHSDVAYRTVPQLNQSKQADINNIFPAQQMQFEYRYHSHNHYLYGMLVGFGFDIVSYLIIAETLSGDNFRI